MPQEERLALSKQIETEITDYLTKPVTVGDQPFSQSALVRRISLFENKIYPTGKFDTQGNYKHWFDIISPRIDSEIKNIDFDTKDILAYSPRKIDEVPCLVINLKLTEWLRDNGQAEELNSAIEEGSGWGNVVWKKVRGSYERVDLRNFYVINQTARDLSQSPAIERHQLTQSELRARGEKWKYIDEIIKDCGQKLYKAETEGVDQSTTTPYYSIYERNGEISLKDLKEFKGEEPSKGDENTYVLAKVIGAGTETSGGGVSIKYIAFAEEISKMPYKEYHRGRYKGRWFREGLYELLFDVQVRANEIGNQISLGLQYASKTIFTDEDKSAIQNVITDLKSGDFIRSKNLRQVEVRMQGFDQLLADYNRIIELANDIANSREVVQGEALSGQPFRSTALLNVNANKLFDFIREKLAIPLREIFEEWQIPELIKDLTAEEALRLSGDSALLQRMHEFIVENWYIRNLINIGPHTKEMANTIKQQKLDEMKKRTTFISEYQKTMKGLKPLVSVVITGENTRKDVERETFAQFIPLETDPIRRSALVEEAMRRSGIDVGSLPKTPADQLTEETQPTPAKPSKEIPVPA
jgi:hypothetical protein